MLAIELAHGFDCSLLIGPLRRSRRSSWIHEVIEARKLAKSILPPEFIKARNSVFAIAKDIKRNHVDLLCLAIEPPHLQVLQKHGRVVQGQQAQALASQGQSPVWHPHGVHEGSRLALKGFDDRNSLRNLVRVDIQLAILQ